MAAVMDGTGLMEEDGRTLMELFLDHYERIEAYFGSRIPRRQDATDLVQEVCPRLLGIPDERTIENRRAYLWSVARSVLCDYLDRNGRHQSVDIDDPLIQPLLVEEMDCGRQLDDAWHMRLLPEVMEKLPPKCRTVMELKWQHDRSYQEIADFLGISINTVKKHLKDGLKLCRQHMPRPE